MIFTTKQVNELVELIRNMHWIFINQQLGSKHIPDSVLRNLKKYGISKMLVKSKIESAFEFGILSTVLNDKRVKLLTYQQLKKFISSGKWIPLTKWELHGLNLIENRYVSDITGLGNKVSNDFKNVIIEGDLEQRKNFEAIIRQEAQKVFSSREGVSLLASKLGNLTGDYARDFGRISQFILHEAFDNGKAFGYIRKYGSDDVNVFKRVYDGACDVCQGLYKTYDRSLGIYKPKIFKLSELLANGTNVNKVRKDWKPVVGATHPWCRCDLEEVPKDFVYDVSKKRFKEPTKLTEKEEAFKKKYRLKNDFIKIR